MTATIASQADDLLYTVGSNAGASALSASILIMIRSVQVAGEVKNDQEQMVEMEDKRLACADRQGMVGRRNLEDCSRNKCVHIFEPRCMEM